MNKIFISYSSKNAEWVKTYLVPKLESHGVPAHVDYRDFEIGAAALINMERAIEECTKTLLVFTPEYVQSDFAQFEAIMLQTSDPLNSKKKILPLMLHDCPLPKRLGIFTYANFKDESNWETEFNRLISQIKKDFAATAPTSAHYPLLADEHIYMKNWLRTEFELFGRQQELARLDQAWQSAETNVISFVAFGGVGKTTLVNKWLEKMRWDNYRGSQKVFAWSFYSQGTNELVTSADVFINTALQWFGDQNPLAGTPWDKGKRLANLIRQQKTLLLLDGLEPLQSGHDIEKGKIKDAALSTLVTELAKSNNGLCVITTRENVAEIDRYGARCEQINLEHISPEAGCALLRVRRVQGTDEELERLSGAFGNHALALTLLTEYLRQFEGHPAEKGFAIPDINVSEAKGRHARRLMEAFAQQFGNSAELELLQVLGLFNRPAPREAIARVTQAPAISDLTDRLSKLGEAEWLRLLHKLREVKLLAREYHNRPDGDRAGRGLDCHPLVREHFGEKLRQQNPAAWKEAHSRFYEYYKNLPAKELPDTLEEMEPLFAAVAHGCQAGFFQSVFTEIYLKRISREGKQHIKYKLGVINTNLALLANFFSVPFDVLATELNEKDKAYILERAGSDLQDIGRLDEAIHPMLGAVNLNLKNQDWESAALVAGNISDVHLIKGELKLALEQSLQSVYFADKSDEDFIRSKERTKYGNILLQVGDLKKARAQFDEAERLHILYATQANRHYDLLLSEGKYDDVIQRVRNSLEKAKSENWINNIGLDYLALGTAHFLKTIGNFTQAEEYFRLAMENLRQGGQHQYLVRGLLARAAFHRSQNEFAPAWADLEEAREIAERGEMKLHLADYHLEACRVCLAEGKMEAGGGRTGVAEKKKLEAEEHLRVASKMIEEMGYGRRKPEVEELRKQMQSAKA